MPPPRDPSTGGSVRNPADIDSGQYDEQKIWQRYFDNWNQQFRPQTHFGVGPGASATGQSGRAHTIPETLAPIGTTGSTAGLGVSPRAAGLGGAGGAAGSISGAGAGGAGFWGKVGSMAGGNYGQWINTGIGAIGSYLDSQAAQNASKNARRVELWSEENPWGPSVDYRTAGMEQALAALRNQSAGGAAPGGRGGGGGWGGAADHWWNALQGATGNTDALLEDLRRRGEGGHALYGPANQFTAGLLSGQGPDAVCRAQVR